MVIGTDSDKQNKYEDQNSLAKIIELLKVHLKCHNNDGIYEY